MCCKLPQVSVLMGVRYQREELFLLRRSVASILNQTCSDLEFLICEEGSTEEAKEYLRNLSQRDARVRLIPGNGADTLAAKLNRCADAARGEFFARQDDDDASDPERLKRQLDYLNAHPEAAFAGCLARQEQDGMTVGTRSLPEFPNVQDFLFVQPFLHPTLLFRRCVFDAEHYDESARCAYCEDYDLLLRLYARGLTGVNLQEVLFTYHLPPTGTVHRTMTLRWDEARTRWLRFRALGLLPGAIPYVIKPLAVGLLPERFLQRLKRWTGRRNEEERS